MSEAVADASAVNEASIIQSVLDYTDAKTPHCPETIPMEIIPTIMSLAKIHPMIVGRLAVLDNLGMFEYCNDIHRFNYNNVTPEESYTGIIFDEYSEECDDFYDFIDRLQALNEHYVSGRIDAFIKDFQDNDALYYSIPRITRRKILQRFEYDFQNRRMKREVFIKNNIRHSVVPVEYDPELDDYLWYSDGKDYAEDFIATNNKFMNIYDDDLYADDTVSKFYEAYSNNEVLCMYRDNLRDLYNSVATYRLANAATYISSHKQ